MKKRPAVWPYVLLILTVLFWSGNFVLGRGIRDLIPPVSLNFWRWVGALVLLLPFGWPRIRRQQALLRQHWKMLTLMSIPAISIFNTFIYLALQTTTAVNTVLVNATMPIMIVLMAWGIFGERMVGRQLMGVGVSLAGLLFIISRGDMSGLLDLRLASGDLWTLAAGISWATYTVCLRLRPTAMDPVAFLTVMVALGILFLLPFYLMELWQTGGFALSWESLASIAYVCLFPSVLSFVFWNQAVAQVGASRAGVFIHLMPVFSIVLAVLFLGEPLMGFHVMGMALIFTGIALTTMPISLIRSSKGEATGRPPRLRPPH